jgi:hypothetical protein
LIALVLCAVAILYLLPRALFAWRDRALLKLRLAKAGITLVAGIAALGAIRHGNEVAAERAERIVAAVQNYRLQRGRYPERLDQLVPTYLAEIPPAKDLLLGGPMREFNYWASDSGHTLMYVVLPPFGHRLYDFERERWNYLD